MKQAQKPKTSFKTELCDKQSSLSDSCESFDFGCPVFVLNPPEPVMRTPTASYLVEPDLSIGRVFAISQEGPPWSLTWKFLACDPVTLLSVGSLELRGLLGGPASLIRWGDEGAAFRTSAGQIFRPH